MVCTAILKLSGCDIQYSLAGTLRNQMDETEQILAGVTEPHPTADTGFVIRSASGHIEGNHALVLVPDIYHAIHFPGVRGNMISGQQRCPVMAKRKKSILYLIGIMIA